MRSRRHNRNGDKLNCKWTPITEPDEKGYRRYACTRSSCPLEANSPYGPDRIDSNCWGIPRWDELGHWAEIIMAVFTFSKRDYLYLKWMLGLQPTCKCQERAEAANTFGAFLQNTARKLTAWLYNLARRK